MMRANHLMLCPATALPPSSHVVDPRCFPEPPSPAGNHPPRPGSVSHRTHGAALAREIRKGSGVVLRPRVGVACPSVRRPSHQIRALQYNHPERAEGDDYCHRRTSSSYPIPPGGALGFLPLSRLAAHQGLPVGLPPGLSSPLGAPAGLLADAAGSEDFSTADYFRKLGKNLVCVMPLYHIVQATSKMGSPPKTWTGLGLKNRAQKAVRPFGLQKRSMGNGTKAAADVREGQLMLMDQCLAATSQAVVHTAFRYGLANLT
ncbi:hypothetical protein ZWY2020_029162 [Hordeum vulgare]|nr:hypothetical protein ZWY2020_029162 [Hordeum vulgare]